MTTLKLDNRYRRVINSRSRLQQLRQMHAPEIVVRNEFRLLQDAIGALPIDDEFTRITDPVGTDAFVNRFNYIAETEIRLPVTTAAPALHVA